VLWSPVNAAPIREPVIFPSITDRRVRDVEVGSAEPQVRMAPEGPPLEQPR
jgi:hypothetical protein